MPLLLGFAFCTAAWPSFAENLRVTTWNLRSPGADAIGETNALIQQWAATLTQLNPDVILLQGVTDWRTCAQLAQALKPSVFNIAICSSFRLARSPAAGAQQVAILSKQKAYFSWSAGGEPPGEPGSQNGFAFAALQAGRVRIGVFSAEFTAGAGPDAQVRPLLDQLDSVKRWEMNQVQSFVIAATFNEAGRSSPSTEQKTVRLLEEAGFADAMLQLPLPQRSTVGPKSTPAGVMADYFLVEPSLYPTPQILTTTGSTHHPITCDLELDAAKAAAAWTDRARQAQILSQAQAAPNQSLTSVDGSSWAARFGEARLAWLAALGGIGLAVVALIVSLTRTRKREPAAPMLIPEHAESAGASGASYTVVVASSSLTASGPELAARGTAPQPVVHVEAPGTQTQSAGWQQRALDAEERAKRAQAMVRRGVLPHLRRWLKQKLVRKLASDRARLLEAQETATRKALNVDERLNRIELQLQQQNRAYERRIEELTCELVAAKEENRELIRARIAQVRAEMQAARARLLAQAESSEGGA